MPFEIGDFTLRILEVELEQTIRGLSPRDERFAKSLANLQPFGPYGRAACPRLLANLRDEDKKVRTMSLDELRRLGMDVSSMKQVFSLMTTAEFNELRRRGMKASSLFVTRRQVVSLVKQYAADPDPEVGLHRSPCWRN